MSLLGRGETKQIAEVRRLFTTFGYLVARQGATAVIGLAYWAVVTHLFAAQDVGLAAAAASTALLLAAFGALGVPLLLLAEIEAMEPSQRRVTFTTGLAITSVVVLTSAIGTMALSPFLGKSLRLIGQDPAMAGLFVVGAVATMAGLTLDNLAIGLHRGDAQLWRGSLSSILKLACVGALVLASTRTSAGLIFAWALALVASFVLCLPMLGLERTRPGDGSLSHRVAIVRRYGKLSLQHHVLNLSIGLASFIVPLTATLIITPPEVAYFSAAFMLSATLLIIPYLLALSLFAERSGDPGLLHRHVRHTLPVGLALSAAIVLVVEIAAPYALTSLRPRLRGERNHRAAYSDPRWSRLRDQRPLCVDLPSPGSAFPCGQNHGVGNNGGGGRSLTGRRVLGPHRHLRRMGHHGVMRGRFLASRRPPGISPGGFHFRFQY